ncbi:MAG: NAD(P)-dependent oxidoreductase [Haloferacaceae archaeon]
MARVTVTYSETHPVRVDRVRDGLEGHDVRAVELPPGNTSATNDAFRAAAVESDALIVRPGNVSGDLLASADDLRIVAVHGSGYDHVDVAAATDRGVVVTHSPEAVAPSVVEHALGATVALLRDWPATMERTAAGEWNAARTEVKEVGERTVGVVGLGTIGFRVARAVDAAFGADVVGYDPYVTGEREGDIYPRHHRSTVEDAGVELVGFHDLFERSDVVTLHVPLTDETRGMVDADALSRLDGYLVNTARGEVVDESALLDALESGGVAGAALDVRAEEPPADDDPLAGRDDVLATPHLAGVSDGYLRRAADRAAEKVGDVLAGERPAFVVNPAVFD